SCPSSAATNPSSYIKRLQLSRPSYLLEPSVGVSTSCFRFGRDPQRIRNIRDELRELGYMVRLHYVEVPVHEAARRVVRDLEETGRFLDPLHVYTIGDSPRRTFDEVRHDSEWSAPM